MPIISNLTSSLGRIFGKPSAVNGRATGLLDSDDESASAKGICQVSPFLAARHGVNDRLKRAAKAKHQLAVIALALTLALTLSVAGNVYMATTANVQPYLVAVNNETGEVLKAGLAAQPDEVSDAVVEKKIQEVVEGLRTVYVDRRATAHSYLSAYNYIAKGSDAGSFIRSFVQDHGGNPVSQVGDVQRSVVDIQIRPIAGTRSWSVKWAERTITSKGDNTLQVYQGTISVARKRASDVEELRKNPVGVYLDGVTWRKVKESFLDSGASVSPSSPSS